MNGLHVAMFRELDDLCRHVDDLRREIALDDAPILIQAEAMVEVARVNEALASLAEKLEGVGSEHDPET